ncbi:FAD-dependent oxidoreductase [Kaistia dalseonensis]|uniref:3-phenylpropionate/trans-cinnamate dioxygenase ferredoxin reductase subunit n=1 Tax=Kaistia dalseonensis TaxID=410840 RepID=A0ABU0H8N7_9HYPH|nr:FAD-dependent oxidoreductase [Kaistia dalseonensis]MCX5496077.1 FAD-dependent oxidoreductase [Kaistia dalseonensis]MDQ0438681.1 3-phenylpropionate/trans-cinnamate dioxygenase ferredoxin reductase subunit [Kaistia dalseonensis]
MSIERIVIVGTGHAGTQLAASLRQDGYAGAIALIGDETDLPYHKPPLSKAFLKGGEAELQLLRPEEFYVKNRVELMLGRRVAAIGPAEHRVALDDGSTIAYDRLVLATGARPRLPALPGIDLGGVVALRNRADGLMLRAATVGAEDVVVIGGGFIGMELAATFAALGRKVTVIEAAPRILGRAVAPQISEHLAASAVAAGVRLLTATTLRGLEGDQGRVSHVVTANGERIAAQVVVVGIGVLPNQELAEAAGIACANGIVVDRSFRTSHPDIFAIGDVASYEHWMAARVLRLESVQNATDQARAVAKSLLGMPADYRAVPWFWSDQGDAKLQMVGLSFDADEHVVRGESGAGSFSVFHYRAGRLLAIDSINRAADHMLGRKMLAAGFSPPPAAVRDLSVDLRALAEAALAERAAPVIAGA